MISCGFRRRFLQGSPRKMDFLVVVLVPVCHFPCVPLLPLLLPQSSQPLYVVRVSLLRFSRMLPHFPTIQRPTCKLWRNPVVRFPDPGGAHNLLKALVPVLHTTIPREPGNATFNRTDTLDQWWLIACVISLRSGWDIEARKERIQHLPHYRVPP